MKNERDGSQENEIRDYYWRWMTSALRRERDETWVTLIVRAREVGKS